MTHFITPDLCCICIELRRLGYAHCCGQHKIQTGRPSSVARIKPSRRHVQTRASDIHLLAGGRRALRDAADKSAAVTAAERGAGERAFLDFMVKCPIFSSSLVPRRAERGETAPRGRRARFSIFRQARVQAIANAMDFWD